MKATVALLALAGLAVADSSCTCQVKGAYNKDISQNGCYAYNKNPNTNVVWDEHSCNAKDGLSIDRDAFQEKCRDMAFAEPQPPNEDDVTAACS
ncbi:hypothetical protein E4U53_007679 [Claviceps sorghi]|nr:hypothetical protein E4U53_007679 [Claviceps sorghi]